MGIGLSVLGLAGALRIPPAAAAAPSPRIAWNPLRGTNDLPRLAYRQHGIWPCILGPSWFWTVGATLMTEFPVIARDTPHGGGSMMTLLLSVFAIGVGAGSIGCARLLHGEVSPRLVPFAALGISAFCWDFGRAAAAAAAGLLARLGLGAPDVLIVTADRLEPVPGTGGGRLHVRGPNVMPGYFLAGAPGVLCPPAEGWYDTGDIVSIDGAGFASIKGRAKRFAKIGGEMVSLTAAEGLAFSLWPDEQHAVVHVPDPRKGERLVLVTTRSGADMNALLVHARERGVPQIMVPRALLPVPALPLLPAGKVDDPAVERIAREVDAA